MAEKSKSAFLKVVLLIFAIVCLVYGICYLFIPDYLVKLSGGTPVFHGWLRWSGGILISLGIGAILVYRNLKNQGIFITVITLGCLLAGLGLLWAWIGIEEGANTWFTALPTIICLVLAVLFYWSGQQAKEILNPGKE
jgi:formate hydrogenlyase subunit 3/multisubunit Na+/H+ antiporter MnhD subunit